MLPSLPLRLTREGLYFFGVLLFVIAGAVVKELNLLLMLTGMLVAPLLLQARTVCSTLRRLHISRRLPVRVGAGEAFFVRLVVANDRRHLASWFLLLRDHIQPAGKRGRERSAEVEVRIAFLAPLEERTVSYRLCLTQRGIHDFGPIRVSTRFPLGLLMASRTHAVRDKVLVYPRLGRMSRDWSRLVFGNRVGSLRTRGRKGLTEAEFYGLRDWRPGDSPRWVHWRTSARLREPVVRQFEQQQKAEVGLLIDLWLPANPTNRQKIELETAISFAASAIADLGREGNARVTIVLAQEVLACWTGVASASLADELLTQLALAKGGEHDLTEAVGELTRRVPEAGRLIVVSTRKKTSLFKPPAGSPSDAQDNASLPPSPTMLPDPHRLDRLKWIHADGDVIAQYIHFFDGGNRTAKTLSLDGSNG